jgi:DNA repair photolyase
LKRVRKDLEGIPPGEVISISNSSDPYSPLEKTYEDTRKCLRLFKNHNLRILIITKSDVVVRDIDVLRDLHAAVTITLTTLKENIYQRLEPNAPSPQARLKAIQELVRADIPTGVRIDPIFPLLTDNEIKAIVQKIGEIGVQHVVSSTFKPRHDSWRKIEQVFPQVARELKPLYFRQGQKIGNAWYLPGERREQVMLQVKKECDKYNIPFATCREGFDMGSSRSCDGSHLTRLLMP